MYCRLSQMTEVIFDHTISLSGIYPRWGKKQCRMLQPFLTWKIMSLLIFRSISKEARLSLGEAWAPAFCTPA